MCRSDVRDIHDVVEVTVYDEDKDHKYEFLGKVGEHVPEIDTEISSGLDCDSADANSERRETLVQTEGNVH